MLIGELMAWKTTGEVFCIRPAVSLLEMAHRLREHGVGALLVTDDGGRLAGVVSERDLVRALALWQGDLSGRQVHELMTRSVVTCRLDDDVVDTLQVMSARHIRHIPVVEEGRPRAMLSIRDFEHACRHLRALAETDELTGLANRRSIMKRMADELTRVHRYGAPLALGILDIDHFKRVNDRFGHQAGDRVLCALASLMVRELRAQDGIGRLGGEEFAILLPHTGLAAATGVCERVLLACEAEEIVIGGDAIAVTVSLGLTEVGRGDLTCEQVLGRADENLYRAKIDGRNRIVAGHDEAAGRLARRG